MKINTPISSLSLIILIALSASVASAETLQFSLIKAQLELPEKCKVASDTTSPIRKVRVQCDEPYNVIKYREDVYPATKTILQTTHDQAKELFAKSGLTVQRIQEIKVRPLKTGGEVTSFAMVMTQKKKVIAQVYTLVSFDKKSAILITYTYEPSVGAEVHPTRMKQLSAFKPLKAKADAKAEVKKP